MRTLIFDCHAVMAWLRREPQARFVADLLIAVRRGEMAGGICLINLGEVYCATARKHGGHAAEQVMAELADLEWTTYPVDQELTLAAARLKARFRVSYADAFALACAQEQQAELVTGDPKLLVADHGVPILWPGVGQTPEV